MRQDGLPASRELCHFRAPPTGFTPLLDVFARRRCWPLSLLTSSLDVFVRRVSSTLLFGMLLGCDVLPHPGDTAGIQHKARWMRSGRVEVDTDPQYTIVRLRLDSATAHAGHDVILVFNDAATTE